MVRTRKLLGGEMIDALRDGLDSLLGRGRYSAAVPVMDGPLQPNQGLDGAETIVAAPGLDNVVAVGDLLYFSSHSALIKLGTDGVQEGVMQFDSEVTCLATDGHAALAIGLDGGGIAIRGGPFDGQVIQALGDTPFICPTDAAFLNENTLLVASGSARFPASEWKRDLMTRGHSGSVWKMDLASGSQQIVAKELSYPFGLVPLENGDLLVSEAWRHRLIRIGQSSSTRSKPVLEDLPGYPARICRAAHGGYWLTIFAPRNQLVEFILGERGYCDAMVSTVDPAYWIAPALASGVSFKETLQYGAVKRMGILKPWAPTWSYGLVVLLGSDFIPVASWHSRADGTRHGITCVSEYCGRIVVGAKGSGEALVLNTSNVFEELG